MFFLAAGFVLLVAICKQSLQVVFLLNLRVSVSSWSLFIVSAGKSWSFCRLASTWLDVLGGKAVKRRRRRIVSCCCMLL